MNKSNVKYVILTVIFCMFLLVVFAFATFKTTSVSVVDEYGNVNEEISQYVKNRVQDVVIFNVNENELKEEISANFNVSVRDVVRCFPSTVIIKTEQKSPYYFYVTDRLVFWDKHCNKVDGYLEMTENGQKSENESVNADWAYKEKCIEIKSSYQEIVDSKRLPIDEIKEYLLLISTFSQDYAFDMKNEVESIDFSLLTKNKIVFKLRLGAILVVDYPTRNFSQKLRLSFSAINNADELKKTQGKWECSADKVAYTPSW